MPSGLRTSGDVPPMTGAAHCHESMLYEAVGDVTQIVATSFVTRHFCISSLWTIHRRTSLMLRQSDRMLK